MLITYKETNLRFKETAAGPKKEQEKPLAFGPKNIYIPPKGRPRRKFRLPGSIDLEEKEAVLAGAL
jgi:hypothetical protein